MIVAVPWRKDEDDAKMDGECLKGEVVMVDKDYKEKLETEEHVPPKRVCAGVCVRSDMSPLHAVAQGVGETSEHADLPKAD